MYRKDFWILWEKARVGCFERTACILSIVKQITSPGGMNEAGARAWCTGKTRRNRVGREVGEGIGMGNTCNSMADSCQCITIYSFDVLLSHLGTSLLFHAQYPVLTVAP